MDLRELNDQDSIAYNKLVTHVIQSWQWGEFRKSLGLPLLRFGMFKQGRMICAFQLTLHKIPFLNLFVGYLPKGPALTKDLKNALKEIARKNNCAFIKVEPDIELNNQVQEVDEEFRVSPKPLFTKYNFVLDLSLSEEALFKNLHPKTRYNIRLAQKKGVKVEERTDDRALEIYLNLYFETTTRQNYLGHSRDYHRQVWQTLKKAGMARFLIASFEGKPLTAWMLLNFGNKLYYPYGGSSNKFRELMHSNLVAWEAIKLGKKLKLKYFDMWGALGPDADPKDPWFGFHRFKQGYGGSLVEYIGTFDLVLNPLIYYIFNLIDSFTSLKVFLLKIIG